MSIPHYFHLGIDAEDYVSPSVSVHFDFDSLCEGLPDEEQVVPDAPECSRKWLEEERPEMIFIDEADYGDE